jgi:hypothetical protein
MNPRKPEPGEIEPCPLCSRDVHIQTLNPAEGMLTVWCDRCAPYDIKSGVADFLRYEPEEAREKAKRIQALQNAHFVSDASRRKAKAKDGKRLQILSFDEGHHSYLGIGADERGRQNSGDMP